MVQQALTLVACWPFICAIVVMAQSRSYGWGMTFLDPAYQATFFLHKIDKLCLPKILRRMNVWT
jgi:hypothetical protein